LGSGKQHPALETENASRFRAAETTLDAETIAGDVAIISRDADNQITTRLEVSDGEDSVAASANPGK
jgi:hypothetical protein